MVLDIQTVHHILKNTAVQNVNKPFVYITDFTSTLSIRVDVIYFSSHYFKIEPDWRRWSRKKLHFCQANQVFLVFRVRGIVI
jgi:hypothetical protein